MEERASIAWTFARLFTSPITLVIELVFFGLYWLVFYDLVRYASGGVFLVEIPLWLLVIFVFSSSILATIAVAYLRTASRRRRGAVGIAQSPLTVALGTAVVTCACNIPLLAPFLAFIGMNSIGVSIVISDLARWQEPLVLLMIAVNVVSALYYLRLIESARKQGVTAPGLKRP